MRTAVGIALLAVLAGLVSRLLQPRPVSPATTNQTSISKPPRQETASPSIVNDGTPSVVKKEPIPAKNLESLKKKWLEMKQATRDDRVALARETVALLGFSEETLDLMEFLVANGNGHSEINILDELSLLLRSEGAEETRKKLVALISGPQNAYKSDCLQKLSFEAGRGCNERELQSFLLTLENENCAEMALFGRNSELATTDPIKAITSILHALEDNVRSKGSSLVLGGLMRNLPNDADFGAIEKLFPPDRLDNPAISKGRDWLIREWATNGPKGVTDYLISNPEKMGPDKVSIIATAIAMKDAAAGLDWAQQFPAGPNFDAAIIGVLPSIHQGYPAQAYELVSLMSDPALKAKSFEMIKNSQADMEKQRITPK